MSFIHLNFNGQPFKDTQVVGSELDGLEGLVVPSSIYHIIDPLDYKMSHEQKCEIVWLKACTPFPYIKKRKRKNQGTKSKALGKNTWRQTRSIQYTHEPVFEVE